jgi:hypothetical protein
MKSLILATFPLITILPACASDGVYDELAGEQPEDDVAGGKADEGAVDGAYTYFRIATDLRKCSAPACGGFFIDRLNRSTTTCHDGSVAGSCYTPELDWGESNLTSTEQRQKLLDAAQRSGLMADTGGTFAIVRGRFAPVNTTTPMPELGRFIVTEAWVADGDTVASGVFVKVRDAGINCITTPCPTLEEKGLNEGRSASIGSIDFGPAALSDEQVEGLMTKTFSEPGGIIIAGDRFFTTESGQKIKNRTATAAFHKLVDDAAQGACFVGGCSSEVCSDQEGVITTCDFHPEYACYAAATCERQADGNCGWTQTAELQACIANPPTGS